MPASLNCGYFICNVQTLEFCGRLTCAREKVRTKRKLLVVGNGSKGIWRIVKRSECAPYYKGEIEAVYLKPLIGRIDRCASR